MKHPARKRAPACMSCGAACLLWVSAACADRVRVEIEGVEGDMQESARAASDLHQYEDRDVSAAEVRRLFERADEQIRLALEPFGYYEAQIDSRLEKPEEALYRAVFSIRLGEPVIVREERIEVDEEAKQLEPVKIALERFEPKVGERLDHAKYEQSKQQIDTALANEGFLDAQLVKKRVEVVRSARTAAIDLDWDAGERYRIGEVRYSDSQLPKHFVERFTPWKPGEYYTADKLMQLQQTLVDADYFATVGVTPDLEHARDGVAPIDVLLVPAKRTVYTANLYVSTDSGPGGRLGVDRRWVNKRGHKFSAEAEYSTRLQQISTNYRVLKPGLRPRQNNYGLAYRDEETDTSKSRMARAVVNEVTERWRGFTRTIGLQYLHGTFEIADEPGDTSLLYAEGLLTRKAADDLYFPASGYSLLYGLRASYEALLSDTSFVQARAEAKWLRKIGEDGRFIARAGLGAMIVEDFDALPPELRFFAGGDRSVRGFDYQQIGEENASGGVIGGEYLAVASAEYEHYFLENWGAAAFVDAGDAFIGGFNANVGVGLGVRWKSPIGLVRLDVARPVVSDFEHKWRIHLVIGPDL
jgi:translocation and assembly module TamA